MAIYKYSSNALISFTDLPIVTVLLPEVAVSVPVEVSRLKVPARFWSAEKCKYRKTGVILL